MTYCVDIESRPKKKKEEAIIVYEFTFNSKSQYIKLIIFL